MAFFKRVNVVGPGQEKLSGWINERYAGIGQIVQLQEDEFARNWTVAEAGDQLILESQVDPRHVLTVESAPIKGANGEAVPAAVAGVKAPRKPRAPKLAAVAEQH